MSIADIIADKLTKSGTALVPKHNSIFTAAEEYGDSAPVMRTAVKGLVNIVSNDVSRYRNVILQTANEIEDQVKTRSKVSSAGVADKIHFDIISYNNIIQVVSDLNITDVDAVTNVDQLPEQPGIIEFDKQTVMDNINNMPAALLSMYKELEVGLPDNHLENLHDQLFSNIGRNNQLLASFSYNILAKLNDVTLCLMLAYSYREGTLGTSNYPASQMRVKYINNLINILVTLLRVADKQYSSYVANDIVIINTKKDKDITTVAIVGDVYKKFLEDHNVDLIFGYALGNDTNRATIANLVSNEAMLLDTYAAATRMASVRASMEHINVLRLAYKLVIREHLDGLTESQLEDLGLLKDHVPEVANDADEYINSLNTEELLEVTKVTRHLTAIYVYNDEGFLRFSSYMQHYAKVFPKLEAAEVAACATIAHTIDILEEQISVEKVK